MKKYLFFLLVALLPTILMPTMLMAQTAGGQVVRSTPKPKPKPTPKPRPTPTPKPKPQSNPNQNAGTNNSVVSPQKEDQPKPRQDVEAAGYDVTFTCNVPSATMLIDGMANGTASGSRFLKTGSHTVKLVADGYENFSQSITVNSKQQSFTLTMTEKKNVMPPVLQNLINNMIYVEGGTFTMGATSEQGTDVFKEEKPVHQVMLSSFSIGKYEVTQEEWEAVMGSNPSYFKGKKLPVENVSWDDCQEFIGKLSQMTGKQFRLPTEAEWEYAARGGNKSRGYKYASGSDIGSVAWYWDNSGGKTHEVGQKQPNELGLYDMSGNVWEWCQDWYGKYSKTSQTNPTGSSSGSYRVFRGGSWGNNARYCRVSDRSSSTPGNRISRYLGLRLAQ